MVKKYQEIEFTNETQPYFSFENINREIIILVIYSIFFYFYFFHFFIFTFYFYSHNFFIFFVSNFSARMCGCMDVCVCVCLTVLNPYTRINSSQIHYSFIRKTKQTKAIHVSSVILLLLYFYCISRHESFPTLWVLVLLLSCCRRDVVINVENIRAHSHLNYYFIAFLIYYHRYYHRHFQVQS